MNAVEDNPMTGFQEELEALVRYEGYVPLTQIEAVEEPTPTLFPYPSSPVYKTLMKGPVLMWRLGLGPLLGWRCMILTTWGRKSNLPRHTPVEYREFSGRKYVYDAHGARADWYRNIEADPRVTIQATKEVEHAIARRVVDDKELEEVFSVTGLNPLVQQWTKELGPETARRRFVAQKERFFVLTFDPTDEETPAPVKVDLVWIWGVVIAVPLLALALLLRVVRKGR